MLDGGEVLLALCHYGVVSRRCYLAYYPSYLLSAGATAVKGVRGFADGVYPLKMGALINWREEVACDGEITSDYRW
ncbi:hypothetical protein FHS30_001304 [Simiduia aestuariiviva]|uniref:Uncharacterized protein n=1 Tax=Simiduia aestuariiviva TaxID=1510459 RepID=A0A839UNK8_9GAMM|nr:hypothetical protein [Simiduia aestuariiviva]